MTTDTKPRNPWVAALLTLPAPGLGQLYCGHLQRALAIASIYLLLNPLFFMILLRTGLGWNSILLVQIVEGIFGLVVLIDAWRLAKREGEGYQLQSLNRVGVYLLFVLFTMMGGIGAGMGGAYYLRDSMEAYHIPSRSMLPTIQPGDHVFVRKGVYEEDDPALGDLIVFPNPQQRTSTWVKRVVALGGQTVEMKEGRLWIDGEMLPREDGVESNGSASYAVKPGEGKETFGPFVVPDYTVFALGDNRAASMDSRHVGAIAITSIEGKVERRHWPLGRAGEL